MKYITLYEYEDGIGTVLANLEKQVNKHIEFGFKPLGGVCISTAYNDFSYAAQAMIKEEEE